MADPWAILAGSRVDIPGVLAAATNQRQARMAQLLQQRQIEREDKEIERQDRIRSETAAVFSPQAKGGDPASPAAGGPPSTLVDPSQLPPRTDGLSINRDALTRLYQDDPATAMQVQNMIYSADKAHFEQVARTGETMAQVAFHMKQVAPDQRQAELQAWMPELTRLGLHPEDIAQADLSDNGLDRYLSLGQDLKDLVAASAPKPMGVSPGEVVIDQRSGKELFRSPVPRIIVGADGQQYAVDVTPGAPAAGATPSASGGAPAHPAANLVPDATAVIKQVYPGARITDGRRDPNSALGRANPRSYHNNTGAAVDVAPIPGMTFSEYVRGIHDAGYEIVEARDEATHPLPHTTGPNWHVVIGQPRHATQPAPPPGFVIDQ